MLRHRRHRRNEMVRNWKGKFVVEDRLSCFGRIPGSLSTSLRACGAGQDDGESRYETTHESPPCLSERTFPAGTFHCPACWRRSQTPESRNEERIEFDVH